MLLDPKCRILLVTKVHVLKMDLDLLGLQHVAYNNVPDLEVLNSIAVIPIKLMH